MRFLPCLVLVLLGAACTPAVPPRWAEGGAPLAIPAARWQRGGDTIDLRADGQVFENGKLVFLIDRVGRVVDEDYEPLAILLPDGRLAGADHAFLGQIGMSNASPPDRGVAWLSVLPDGNVVYFDDDGDRAGGGRWAGCVPPGLRACTLVTHLVALRNFVRSSGPGMSVGVGVGVGY